MCGLFILQNIEMESEHNTNLFNKNVRQACENINYFSTCKLIKSMYDSRRCTFLLSFKNERYVEKEITSLIFYG